MAFRSHQQEDDGMMRVIVDFVRGNLAIQRIVHPPFIASYTLVGVHWCLVAALFSV